MPLLPALVACPIAHGHERLGALELVVVLAAAVRAFHLAVDLWRAGRPRLSGAFGGPTAFALALEAKAPHHSAYSVLERILWSCGAVGGGVTALIDEVV